MGCERAIHADGPPGPERIDDRQVVSGIIHVAKPDRRWCGCPVAYNPSTKIYSRLKRFRPELGAGWRYRVGFPRSGRVRARVSMARNPEPAGLLA